jgi:hypothetical protein
MASKTQQQLLQQAIKELHINVPIYQVRTLDNGGLRLWLYGHHHPVDWQPKPPAPAKPRRKRKST